MVSLDVPQMPAPSYLVELIDPTTGIAGEVDLCAKLPVAIQRVHEHLKEHGARPRVETSYDKEGQLEGVGFFDPAGQLMSCITVYYLERDTDEPSMPDLVRALELTEPARSIALNAIFNF